MIVRKIQGFEVGEGEKGVVGMKSTFIEKTAAKMKSNNMAFSFVITLHTIP